MADHVGAYIVGIEHGDMAATVAAEIDKTFSNSMAETLTETEKAFNLSFIAMADSIIMIVRLVSLVVIIIIIAVAANTMSMTTRERIGEYAILKTLGFGGWRIAGLIFGESLVISHVGAVFGIVAYLPCGSGLPSVSRQHFSRLRRFEPDRRLRYDRGLIIGILAAIVPPGIRFRYGLPTV